MENDNIQKLIEAISASPELQQQLQSEADKPVTRAACDREATRASLLNSLAQAAGLNLSSNDMSQMTSMLSQIGNLVGNTQQPSGGGLQLLSGGKPAQTQAAAPAIGMDDLLAMFSGGNTQAANNNLLSLLGGSTQQVQQTSNAANLGNFLSLFSGASKPAAASSGGLSGAKILKLLLKLLL